MAPKSRRTPSISSIPEVNPDSPAAVTRRPSMAPSVCTTISENEDQGKSPNKKTKFSKFFGKKDKKKGKDSCDVSEGGSSLFSPDVCSTSGSVSSDHQEFTSQQVTTPVVIPSGRASMKGDLKELKQHQENMQQQQQEQQDKKKSRSKKSFKNNNNASSTPTTPAMTDMTKAMNQMTQNLNSEAEGESPVSPVSIESAPSTRRVNKREPQLESYNHFKTIYAKRDLPGAEPVSPERKKQGGGDGGGSYEVFKENLSIPALGNPFIPHYTPLISSSEESGEDEPLFLPPHCPFYTPSNVRETVERPFVAVISYEPSDSEDSGVDCCVVSRPFVAQIGYTTESDTEWEGEEKDDFRALTLPRRTLKHGLFLKREPEEGKVPEGNRRSFPYYADWTEKQQFKEKQQVTPAQTILTEPTKPVENKVDPPTKTVKSPESPAIPTVTTVTKRNTPPMATKSKTLANLPVATSGVEETPTRRATPPTKPVLAPKMSLPEIRQPESKGAGTDPIIPLKSPLIQQLSVPNAKRRGLSPSPSRKHMVPNTSENINDMIDKLRLEAPGAAAAPATKSYGKYKMSNIAEMFSPAPERKKRLLGKK
eukprot:sb/3463261/